MTQQEILACGLEAVKQMLRERGFTWSPYANGCWHVRGAYFSQVFVHPERITARDLDRPWLCTEDDEDDETREDYLESIMVNGLCLYA